MQYDPAQHHRCSVRLQGYDYTRPGAYFVTVCTQHRQCLLGEIIKGKMRLNEHGQIVTEEWMRTAEIRPHVSLDAFIVMPNHLHGIFVMCRGTWQRAPTERFGKPTSDSIPTIVRLFKSITTKRINAMRGMPGVPLWQRNYSERVIRNENELLALRQDIANNPLQWELDHENPLAQKER